MKRVKWPSGAIDAIPEDGELFIVDDGIGTRCKVEKFAVDGRYWKGTGKYEWRCVLHTSQGVLLSGVSEDYQAIVELMERDIERCKA